MLDDLALELALDCRRLCHLFSEPTSIGIDDESTVVVLSGNWT